MLHERIMNKRLQRLNITLFFLLVQGSFLLLTNPALADKNQKKQINTKAKKMEEIIVIGDTYLNPTLNIPNNYSFMNVEDIEKSTATNISELLSQFNGAVLSSFGSHSKRSSIDVRGSGDSKTNNILYVIDGMKLFAPDLSGTDISKIQINNIKEIKFIPGANTVRYGSGAIHGIVDIKTQAKYINKREINAISKENNGLTVNLTLNQAINNNAIGGFYSFDNYNGFKKNDKLEADFFSLNYKYRHIDNLSQEKWHIYLNFNQLNDSYQLPAAQERNNNSNNNTASAYTDGTTDQKNINLIYKAFFSQAFSITSTFSHGDNISFILGNSDLNSISLNKRPQINYKILNSNNKITAKALDEKIIIESGLEYTNADLERHDDGKNTLPETGSIFNAFVNHSLFTTITYNLTSKYKLYTGYRKDHFSNKFKLSEIEVVGAGCDLRRNPSACTIIKNDTINKTIWKNEALELTLSKALGNNTNFYIATATSFRTPNIDELNLFDEKNPLKPQKGKHFDLGLSFNFPSTTVKPTLFYSRTDNEIIYREETIDDTFIRANINYPEPIIRKGIELTTKSELTNSILLNTNYTYLKAYTKTNKNIPLVPKTTASASINILYSPNFSQTFFYQYVGQKNHGNDFASNGNFKIDSYQISSTHFICSLTEKTDFSIGISNVFNETYFTNGYGQTGYLGNPRHLTVKFKQRF